MSLTGIGEVAEAAASIVKQFFPDKTEQERQQFAMALTVLQGQMATNTAEASNPSVFVSGWRPFVGWVCGSGFAMQFVVAPLLTWGSTLYGHPVTLPGLDIDTLLTLLAGMLGLGGLRSFERVKGVARS
jgi:hypothetical protein